VIARDARGSLVHVRRQDDGECVGCIELGLYEIVRNLILAETRWMQKKGAAVTDIARAIQVQPRHCRVVIVPPPGRALCCQLIHKGHMRLTPTARALVVREKRQFAAQGGPARTTSNQESVAPA
jgi:hypothetical protein